MNLIELITLFALPLLAGVSLLYSNYITQQRMKLLLSFSGAYLLALCFLHLIPDVYSLSNRITTGIWVLVGFLIQLFLEFFSKGIEHGHYHTHHDQHRFPLVLMISICLHSILEAMPLAEMPHGHDHGNSPLLTGILLHKIPIAITLMSVLLHAKLSKTSALMYFLIFCITAPLGVLIAEQLDIVLNNQDFYKYSTALVIGVFLHIATTILFESSDGHRFNLMKIGLYALGSILAYFSVA